MTCVKTGVKVHFIDYGKVVAADLHQVGNVFIIRVLGSVEETGWVFGDIKYSDFKVTHEVWIDNSAYVRDDLGIFVVCAECLREL